MNIMNSSTLRMAKQFSKKNQVCKKAINEVNSLVIQVSKGSADLPKIDGLVLVKGSLRDTDYQEYKELKQNWEQIVKDQEKLKLQEESNIYEQRKKLSSEFDPSIDNYLSKNTYGFIQLMKEPIGYINLIILMLFFICLLLIKENKVSKKINPQKELKNNSKENEKKEKDKEKETKKPQIKKQDQEEKQGVQGNQNSKEQVEQANQEQQPINQQQQQQDIQQKKEQ
eukprot:TRINITY_DN2560_c0_g1_i5.p2 TRINITY_DN2560_c0_g1~~TRINITY_DN2560_c0_g1_i5.p2  ORF type:complete len:226 (+),score=63.02 TRINITY_DN2560_c0_g1_i5:635-1312(+)